MKSTSETMKKEHSTWLKRIGVAGFLFFLIKGLIWIGLWVLTVWFGYNLL